MKGIKIKSTVLGITGYAVEEIKAFTLPQRIAAKNDREAANNVTAMLVIDAVVQGNDKVLESLISLYDLHMESCELDYELSHFRNWLSTLLVS